MFKFAFHLGIQIECTNGTLVSDILDHYPSLPLFVNYNTSDDDQVDDVYAPSYPILTMEDELGIYHTLQLHDRVRQLHLNLPSSILRKALVFMDGHFPMLEHLFLSSTAKNNIPLTLPETFLAPNLRHLTLPDISPQRLFRFFTTTVSLATLKLSNIQTCYFHLRLLVAHLRLIPQLEELSIVFSTPILFLGTKEELLGEEETPVMLPNLKTFGFEGVNVYLECLVSQISAPLLEQIRITLFSQITLSLPRLSHLINTTEAFKPLKATVDFGYKEVSVKTAHKGDFFLCVRNMPLNLRVDWAAHICHALAPTLSGVEHLTLGPFFYITSTEWQFGEINSTMWHTLLRSFVGVKELHIDYGLVWQLCQALQADDVGSDPGFLPHLEEIVAGDNLFALFIDARRLVGRHVRFLKSLF